MGVGSFGSDLPFLGQAAQKIAVMTSKDTEEGFDWAYRPRGVLRSQVTGGEKGPSSKVWTIRSIDVK